MAYVDRSDVTVYFSCVVIIDLFLAVLVIEKLAVVVISLISSALPVFLFRLFNIRLVYSISVQSLN